MLWQRRALILGTAAICAAAGCASGRLMRRGQQAERAGQYHVAYDLYCQAAAKRPSSSSIAGAIARVVPLASRYWENHAHRALQADDYRTAWKHFMRVLTIRPDHPSAAELIRRIERDHRQQIADARRAYLVGGETALAAAEPPPPARPRDLRPPGDRLARGSEPTTPPTPEPQAPTVPSPAPAAPAAGQGRVQSKPTPPPVAEPSPADPGRAASRHRPGPRPATRHDSHSDYLVTRVLSRENRRFPKMAETVDGLFIKLKDTDPGPDADVHIYRGRERIKKVKDWPPNHRVRVMGRSGRYYEIVILEIIDRTETVRFGVRPVR